MKIETKFQPGDEVFLAVEATGFKDKPRIKREIREVKISLILNSFACVEKDIVYIFRNDVGCTIRRDESELSADQEGEA